MSIFFTLFYASLTRIFQNLKEQVKNKYKGVENMCANIVFLKPFLERNGTNLLCCSGANQLFHNFVVE